MMRTAIPNEPTVVEIDAAPTGERLELWRHSLGHGGINPRPLPEHVVDGVRALQPRLIRVFIQEFFDIYRGGGRFDWSRLDPYMDALAATEAKLVAALAIKPSALYPETDPARWRPREAQEWQNVVARLVQRYSVERPLVTHWEIGNEPDIGEHGGCPYLIEDPEDYAEYYAMTVRPILEEFPEARVGGPALANGDHELLPGLVDCCRRTGTKLDFVSWHLYHDSPGRHAESVRRARRVLERAGDPTPELMITEWNAALTGGVSVEEQAFDPRRAAIVAAAIIEMAEAGLDWSFYYHIRDQAFFHGDFATFFSEKGLRLMARHWNELPHRLGLFGVDGRVRPQYFVYRMLARMGGEKLETHCPGELRALAGRDGDDISLLLVNHGEQETRNRVASLLFRNLSTGPKQLRVRRIDGDRRWGPEKLELCPSESRKVCTSGDFECQVLLPVESVALLRLVDEPA